MLILRVISFSVEGIELTKSVRPSKYLDYGIWSSFTEITLNCLENIKTYQWLDNMNGNDSFYWHSGGHFNNKGTPSPNWWHAHSRISYITEVGFMFQIQTNRARFSLFQLGASKTNYNLTLKSPLIILTLKSPLMIMWRLRTKHAVHIELSLSNMRISWFG